MERRTLLLINPVDVNSIGYHPQLSLRYEPLNLGIIAALTPPGWKIKIMDENVRRFHYYPADLVGFTAMTNTANRVYELAKIYRAKGIKTVMGGIHATMCPEEASRYMDCVVIGEAESIWAKVIEDFENGTMKQFYRGEYTSMVYSPKPRRDLFFPGYFFAGIQTNRGCPMNCEYCSVTAFNGSKYRFRPIQDVIEEMKEIPQKWLFIVDDNIVGHNKAAQERAIELFRAMVEHKVNKYFFTQTAIDVVDNEEVLKWAAKAGCKVLFIGVESSTVNNLEFVNKNVNLRIGVNSYDKAFRKIHKYGIGVTIGTIYGFPNDTRETIDRQVNFFRDCNADAIQSTMLTPFPGTGFHKRMKAEGRLLFTNFPKDWEMYSFEEIVYEPYNMTRDELREYYHKAIMRVYEPGHVRRKFYRTLWETKNLTTAYHSYLGNWFYKNLAHKEWVDGRIGWVEFLRRFIKE